MFVVKLCPQLFPLEMDKSRGFGKFQVYPRFQPAKHGNVVGQQVDADQDGQDALPGRDEHDDAGHNAEPAKCVLEHQLGMR